MNEKRPSGRSASHSYLPIAHPMMRKNYRSLILGVGLSWLTVALFAAPIFAEEAVNFDRDIRPLLSENCFFCHGPDSKTRRADLRLDLEAEATDYAIVPGVPDDSELSRRIWSTDPKEIMPPPKSKLRLTEAQKELLDRWIRQGAKYETHWSFVPPTRPQMPTVSPAQRKWLRNPIDHFIAARLGQADLQPTEEADAETLLRRVTLDLTGLPPTPQEVDAFLADESDGAYEKVVDRLLKSPHYGERMALVWLDAARYADSGGYQNDIKRSQWPWRDWVIRAYNANMPFDQFTVEQLAGDLLENATVEQRLATAFNRNHRVNNEGGIIPEEWRIEYVADRVETTSTVWLGLTVGCCRCHDHKYDPLPQRDFYRLFAFFNNIDEQGRTGEIAPRPNLSVYGLPNAQDEHVRLQRDLANLSRQQRDFAGKEKEFNTWYAKQPNAKKGSRKVQRANRSKARLNYLKEHAPDYHALIVQTNKADATLKKFESANLTRVSIMQEMPEPRDTYLLLRGAYDKPDTSEVLQPGTFAALPKMPDEQPKNRLGLARWLLQDDNPLTSRVAVNRYWQMYFGTGLVRSPEDFGSQGERPTHPRLLDWLAVEFRESGWNVKRMQKLIVMSATYRQSSRVTPTLLKVDPQNRLLARGPRFRLYGQAIRDQALAASGLLATQLGGPPVMPHQPAGLWEEVSAKGYKYVVGKGDDLHRRSLYTFWRRTVPPPNMMNFDTSAREVCSVKMQRTNTPLQAINLLNDPQFVEAARALAKRMVAEGGASVESRVQHGHRLVLGRRPNAHVLKILISGHADYAAEFRQEPAAADSLLGTKEASADMAAYVIVANVLLNLDETVTKE